ncbi:DUF4192 domain-containing protein [Mycobacterium sp.]|uniref:DUF4192 domain-containing protein n=1 Tax=Mycobacterium sp. TaxID=1785 RepID=UPI0025F4A355|nr:DUF4192 domain-containing protein [Mycobacterium sp.]
MTKQRRDFELNQPGAVIAALPAVLGFVPEQSLVLLSIDNGELGSVLRVDLSDAVADQIGHLAEVAAAAGPEAAIAVIVDADGAGCPMCNDQYRDLCSSLTDELSRRDIVLWAVHVVDRVAVGGRWHCVDDCGAGGLVDDPSASPLAVAAVLDGRRLYARRADLQAVIAADRRDHERLTALIAERAALRYETRRAEPDACVRRDVEDAMAAAAAVADAQQLSDGQLASLACSLDDVEVRDTLYALAVGHSAGDAESLWALLSRTLPTPWRAEALVLLAFSAYARGDGPLAGVALEAALRCDPGHRMAGMLDQALQSGLRPEHIRELAITGYQLAERIGVRLPPRRPFRRRAV